MIKSVFNFIFLILNDLFQVVYCLLYFYRILSVRLRSVVNEAFHEYRRCELLSVFLLEGLSIKSIVYHLNFTVTLVDSFSIFKELSCVRKETSIFIFWQLQCRMRWSCWKVGKCFVAFYCLWLIISCSLCFVLLLFFWLFYFALLSRRDWVEFILFWG